MHEEDLCESFRSVKLFELPGGHCKSSCRKALFFGALGPGFS